ncbi:phospho-sugar mutase [Egibacter rhizosphaerae]|uniref:Phospho-sugar mutase n=1 Tax=Egibacter rhizosphaerae TaxID=1670831 RepID=A0A411YIR2_9ACTN|nr:phospho-sugar mutase [Egibacter rhizosphaerae]QBI21195.1 phospho-sugar mutase [Egibacter rhizosphaerae]
MPEERPESGGPVRPEPGAAEGAVEAAPVGGLHERVRAWIAEDPDPVTREELRVLLERGDDAALAARFEAPLEFGTAGIRGALGAGPARMNRLVVRRVTAGLAARLAVEAAPEGQRVVVGRDARHQSEAFAEETAAVLAAGGFEVVRLDGVVPTPLLAFAVRHLGASAAVQITASHNPPQDNGYKVYWHDGAQIAPPLDVEISEAMDRAAAPGALTIPEDAAPAPDADATGELRRAYHRAVHGLVEHSPDAPPVTDEVRAARRRLRIVATPLHGVAGADLVSVLTAAGFDDVRLVASQADPDPDFPSVAFPNPEEPGALDAALDEAAAVGADLLIATDPDGDRLAAAVPPAAAPQEVAGEEAATDAADPGNWRRLSGDELGCLLAEDRLAHGAGPERYVGTTVVSSRLLARIAAHHGVAHAETLTGFKWLARVAAEQAAAGYRHVLSYEQALGVMAGDVVMDKDGISAALLLADLVARLADEGRAVPDALDALARRHGLHATGGRSIRLDEQGGDTLVEAALGRLCEQPPAELAGVRVEALVDHREGARYQLGAGASTSLGTPPTELLALELADGSRCQVRPSGTEPLLKCYLEVVEPVADGEAVAVARARAEQRLAAVDEGFLDALGLAPRG